MNRGDADVGDCSLLTPKEMAQADEMAAKLGGGSYSLMQHAATAIADMAESMAPDGPLAILAGPGNNGGDAVLAAHYLRARGRTVRLFTLGEAQGDDAGKARSEWASETESPEAFVATEFKLVVDGLFGAGLQRPLTGAAAELVRRLGEAKARVLSIDLPSGVSGETGQVLRVAPRAEATVTFFRRKPGHLLQPGAAFCGRVTVADIGIPASVLQEIEPQTFANQPELWRHRLLEPTEADHKYARGHAIVFSGGPSHTGAARLAAIAALRGGAGLVTVFAPGAAMAVNAAHLTAIMLRRCDDAGQLADHLSDARLNAFVLGPGFGRADKARAYAAAILEAGRALVLDADGLTAYRDHAADLFLLGATNDARLVLTPHMGEFARLFPDLASEAERGKPHMARMAAARSGAVVVLKGSDTVIAAPDGRAAINATGTPALATAGTGDVLAGLVGAQLANKVPPFEAACIAVWLHGVAARLHGPGLIAEDLPGLMPRAIARMHSLCGFGLPGWPPQE